MDITHGCCISDVMFRHLKFLNLILTELKFEFTNFNLQI